jgi:uncharacterized membrane protein YkoI
MQALEFAPILMKFLFRSYLILRFAGYAAPQLRINGAEAVNAKRVLLAMVTAIVLLVGAGVAYAAKSPSETTDPDDNGEDTYKGSVSAPGQSGSSLQEVAKVDQATAERAALQEVQGGTVRETELEASDDTGYVVYDIEIAGNDGKSYDVKVDAGNGNILDRGLEEDVDEADGAAETEDADGPNEIEDDD